LDMYSDRSLIVILLAATIFFAWLNSGIALITTFILVALITEILRERFGEPNELIDAV